MLLFLFCVQHKLGRANGGRDSSVLQLGLIQFAWMRENCLIQLWREEEESRWERLFFCILLGSMALCFVFLLIANIHKSYKRKVIRVWIRSNEAATAYMICCKTCKISNGASPSCPYSHEVSLPAAARVLGWLHCFQIQRMGSSWCAHICWPHGARDESCAGLPARYSRDGAY